MYVLHGVADWGSQVIHLTLAELDVAYEFRALDWDAGDFATQAFRDLSPFGRIPVLETPDGPIFETAAILLALSEKHPQLAPLVGDKDRGRFLSWFAFVTNTLHPNAMILLHPERLGGDLVMEQVAQSTHAALRQQLGVLDAAAAQGAWWLSPDSASILSLYVVMLLRWVKAFPHYANHSIDAQDYPALHAMARGIEQREAVVRALSDEGLSGAVFSAPACQTGPEG
jgi:glutathione S-transferase